MAHSGEVAAFDTGTRFERRSPLQNLDLKGCTGSSCMKSEGFYDNLYYEKQRMQTFLKGCGKMIETTLKTHDAKNHEEYKVIKEHCTLLKDLKSCFSEKKPQSPLPTQSELDQRHILHQDTTLKHHPDIKSMMKN